MAFSRELYSSLCWDLRQGEGRREEGGTGKRQGKGRSEDANHNRGEDNRARESGVKGRLGQHCPDEFQTVAV